jgi:hypothetical protein
MQACLDRPTSSVIFNIWALVQWHKSNEIRRKAVSA